MNVAETSNRAVSDLRLHAVSCSPAVVSGSRWRNVDIRCRSEPSDLSSVTFAGCELVDCYLGNATLNLHGVTFRECRIRDVTFMFGRLREAQFLDTEIRDCRLRSADLRGAVFRRSLLYSVDIEKADLRGAVFEDTDLEAMENWGWHGYEGASIPDEQKYKYFMAADVGPRLEEALRSRSPGLPPGVELRPFVAALDQVGFASGEVMLLYQDWSELLSLDSFVALGRFLTKRSAGA